MLQNVLKHWFQLIRFPDIISLQLKSFTQEALTAAYKSFSKLEKQRKLFCGSLKTEEASSGLFPFIRASKGAHTLPV